MDPAVRGEWGRAWSQWLKPGSTLVTLMFPVEPEGREGPPWPVSVDLYLQHLDPHGELTTMWTELQCLHCATATSGHGLKPPGDCSSQFLTSLQCLDLFV